MTETTDNAKPDLKKLDRAALRQLILDDKGDTVEIPFKGALLILKPPPTHVVLGLQQVQGESQTTQLLEIITRYVHTPSGERLFNETDVEALAQVPFGADMMNLINKVNELMGVSVSDDSKSPTQEQPKVVGGADGGEAPPAG